MQRSLVVPDAAHVRRPSGPTVVPDCERLDVYRVAFEFQVLAASIGAGRRLGALRDQLDRASVSVVLNIAEGRCDQRRLAHRAGGSPAGARARSPVAWMAGRRETE